MGCFCANGGRGAWVMGRAKISLGRGWNAHAFRAGRCLPVKLSDWLAERLAREAAALILTPLYE